MATGLFNGRKAIKKTLEYMGMTQRELCIKMGITENNLSVRMARRFYDKPGNLAAIVDEMGLALKVEIRAEIIDQDGNKITDVPINADFMEEE